MDSLVFLGTLVSGFTWAAFGIGVLKIALIGAACVLAVNICGAYFNRQRIVNDQKGRQRANTVNSILKNIIRVAIYAVGLLMALEVIGIPYAPVLASIGVVGLAVSFGAQSLVKDIISGIFVIIEDSYRVGEFVRVGVLSGFVEDIGLRTTKLRDLGKELHMIPNGQILDITNYSRGDLCAAVFIPLAYAGDTELALRVVGEACAKVASGFEGFSVPPAVMGIDELKDNRIIVRLGFEADVNQKVFLERQLRLACKEALDAAGMPIPSGITLLDVK